MTFGVSFKPQQSIDSTIKKPNMQARSCMRCNVDISHRYQSARYCITCSSFTPQKKQYLKQKQEEERQYDPPKVCARCRGDLKDRPAQASLCLPCIPEAKKEGYKRYNVKRPGRSNQRKYITVYSDTRSPLEKLLDEIDAMDAQS